MRCSTGAAPLQATAPFCLSTHINMFPAWGSCVALRDGTVSHQRQARVGVISREECVHEKCLTFVRAVHFPLVSICKCMQIGIRLSNDCDPRSILTCPIHFLYVLLRHTLCSGMQMCHQRYSLLPNFILYLPTRIVVLSFSKPNLDRCCGLS